MAFTMQGKTDRRWLAEKDDQLRKEDQTPKVAFGWVREAWVFVNGQLVFAAKNLYQPPSARRTRMDGARLRTDPSIAVEDGVNEMM